ncbi:MAG: AbrB/MazE/SpoVT family DNA-binding domain-containing protein [Chloroflexota bacterium]|nr:AbrB/MazE/SpoVT family DNA-binding domain-containing protein [Chloroflexota bacterium]
MSQQIELALDDQGRLIIPSPLRHQLGLSPGTTLVVEQPDDDAVVLRVQAEQPHLGLINK